LAWLREHDCPWDWRVYEWGSGEIKDWALENGCPTEVPPNMMN